MILIIIIATYGTLLLLVALGFLLHPTIIPQGELQKVTIIIPARNEEHTITECLNSIIVQDYPKELMQIIVVDDSSEDGTVFKAGRVLAESGIEYVIVGNEVHSGKKAGIRRAMHVAKADIIVCRDADTFTTSDKWLRTIVTYMTHSKKEFVIGPMSVVYKEGVSNSLQEIEMSILSLFTISSAYFKVPFLCNGANLAFTRKLFEDTGAYADHLHIASGDDIFFLEAVKKKNKACIGYLKNKDAIVYTHSLKGIRDLFSQKVRWLGKLSLSSSVINWLSALIIGASNLAWLIGLIYAFSEPQNMPLGLFFILSKLLIDILLVFLASSFIKVKTPLPMLVITSVIYPFYASLVAILTFLIKPKWKSN